MNDPLIEAALRPLSGNEELQLSAANFLKKMVTKNTDSASTMVERWNELDAQKPKSGWCISLWAALILVSAVVTYSDFKEIPRLWAWGKWLAMESIFTSPPTNPHAASKLNETEKLLLFGDLTKASNHERKEALWRSEPENPAYFADYAAAFVQDQHRLPPDFIETARRIDPTNAWFTYLAAAVEATDSVKSKASQDELLAGKVAYAPKSWEILDQSRLDHALELLREARNQPKYTDYSTELLRRRLPLLPQENSVDYLDSFGFLCANSVFSNMRLIKLTDAISAKAWSMGETGDISGFREIYGDGDQFLRNLFDAKIGTLADELVMAMAISHLSESFGSAAEKLGLEEDARRWKQTSDSLITRREGRDNRKFMVSGRVVEPGTITGGIFRGSIELSVKQVQNQPPLTDADLKPERLLNHEIFSRISCYVLWLSMAACLGWIASYRFCVSTQSRQLARRMETLLHPSDWVWMIAVGVMLPFAFMMAINRLTPLGGREFGVSSMNFLMPAGQLFGLWVLWLILPVQIVRWRMAKRASEFGFSGPSRMGWLALACAVAFIPMFGWTAISHLNSASWMEGMGFVSESFNFGNFISEVVGEASWMHWVTSLLVGLPLLWLAGVIALPLAGRAERQLYRATSSLVLVKSYAATLLIIAVANIGFRASERYWFKRDSISKFDVSGPGWTSYEYKIAAQLRKELREVLGFDR